MTYESKHQLAERMLANALPDDTLRVFGHMYDEAAGMAPAERRAHDTPVAEQTTKFYLRLILQDWNTFDALITGTPDLLFEAREFLHDEVPEHMLNSHFNARVFERWVTRDFMIKEDAA